ncbi:MAG: hypothetical protein HY516_01665 [Candidatus Aenigmarchaeota archaeon]|nr:hypothetical protein [Candidatus Aenigmarchaeota archaeon]
MANPAASGDESGLTETSGSAFGQLRAARDALYEDMSKDPTASIPWSVHMLLKKLDNVLEPNTTSQQPANGMEKAVNAAGQKPGGETGGQSLTMRVVSFLLQESGKTMRYADVMERFPDARPDSMRALLGLIKNGGVKLPADGGAEYKASGSRGEIVISKTVADTRMPDAPKPRGRSDRLLLFLYTKPDAPDAAAEAYTGIAKDRIAATVSGLRARGYVERGGRKLTERGVRIAQRLERGEKAEPLIPRIRGYFAGMESREITRSEFFAAFPDEKPSTLGNYWKWFVDGVDNIGRSYTVEGYALRRTEDGKVRVEKIPAQPNGASDPLRRNGRGNGRQYASVVESMEQVYEEFPNLRDLVGDRIGLEPRVLDARKNMRPERVDDFYETVKRIPAEGNYMGRAHNQFLVLAARDRKAAEQFMAWALGAEQLSPEKVYAELGRYETAVKA